MASAIKTGVMTDKLELDDAELTELKSCASTVRAARQGIVEQNLAIGDALQQAQAILANHGNGEFNKWLEREFEMSRSTAYTYMQVAAAVPPQDRPIVGQFFDMSALMELTDPKAPALALAAAIEAARTDRRITRSVAAKIVQQTAMDEREARMVVLPEGVRIECCDLRELKIAPSSVDMLLCHPTFDEKSLWQYGELARLASQCLRPGAWCLIYAGKYFLDQIHGAMSKHLTYTWQWDVLHAHSRLIESIQIKQGAKYVVGYRHQPDRPWWQPLSDRLEFAVEKSAGKWQLPVAEAHQLINGLCPSGGCVSDPMVGAGTTAVAAVLCGCTFVGGDIDPKMVRIAKEQVVESVWGEGAA
jgi:hypothetical protein